jgi:hypothetical protein
VFDDLDAVFNLGVLTRGEGRPDIARGYVLFREPKWVRFQFGSKLTESPPADGVPQKFLFID